MLLAARPHGGMLVGDSTMTRSPTGEVRAMSVTRREALAAAIGGGLTTAAAADEGPAAGPPRRHDPVYGHMPIALRKVFEGTFPNHRCIRLGIRGEGDAAVYRGTVFDPANVSSASVRRVGDETVCTPPLFELEVDATGKVLEETPRWFDPAHLPKPVAAAYAKWNATGIAGMTVMWHTEVPRGKDRVYRVRIIVNAVKAYSATFREDGSVVSADPV
jgi:hypothetical protein